MKTKSLKEFKKNPRRITDARLEDLKKWLAELGDISGVVHNERTNEIISGNQRTKIFKLEDCEIIITENYKKPTATGTTALGYILYNGEKFNYRRVRWTAKQSEKANIISNKAGGEWDQEKLIKFFGTEDLRSWGFHEAELKFQGTDTDARLAASLSDEGISYKEQYGVIIICANEKEQQKIFKKLSKEGYNLRVVVT